MANRAAGGARKSQRTVFSKTPGEAVTPRPAPASAELPRSTGGRAAPGLRFLPAAAAPTRPRPQLRAPRRAPPVAAREWSSPSVAATPFDSDSCSSCWGSKPDPEPWLPRVVGGQRGAQTPSSGCGPGRWPAGNRDAREPQGDRLQRGPGLGCSHPGEYLLP